VREQNENNVILSEAKDLLLRRRFLAALGMTVSREDMNQPEDILFDRLVDGELSDAERRALLESLDAQPSGWRRCALAFLEAQSWRDGLGQIVRNHDVASRSIDATLPSPAVVARRPISMAATGRWLAIAAGLMLAFTLGIYQQRPGAIPLATNNASPDVDAPGRIVTLTQPPAGNQGGVDRDSDALTLWVRDDAGQTRPLRVPLVDAGALDQQFGTQFQSSVPSTVRDQLQNRGYQVESKRRYAPLWLENGRPMMVPVEDTKIVPVKENVY
jgi:hypothetical protein